MLDRSGDQPIPNLVHHIANWMSPVFGGADHHPSQVIHFVQLPKHRNPMLKIMLEIA